MKKQRKKSDEEKLMRETLHLLKQGKRTFKFSALVVAPGFVVKLGKDGTPNVTTGYTLAQVADLGYKARERRLQMQKEVDRMEEVEKACCNRIIEELPASSASGIAGQTARAQIERKPVPQVTDWPKFYAYVKKHNAFELLQRRLTETAIKERWDAKEKIPGVGVFNAKKVSLTKL